ncbi:hypothetical protein Nepgr_007724 [Nepenthes gracilis]|uniref:High mobility group B protein 10 n=1 Tax=Nepenthes gracilis TaxID=150966 RepID=A0AAD3S7R5_NEPGR|nr:hypothetical protein Nepgr_007724 [Nepenthes gracilis]
MSQSEEQQVEETTADITPTTITNTTEAVDRAVKKPYPLAEAKYEELVESASIFFDKLRAFHSSLDANLTLPTIGGIPLDLHRLFVLITSHGGLEKVIRERKWKEVILAFEFPPAITNVSFVLRKYYLSLLYHFEQVYYLEKRVPTISMAVPLSQSTVSRSASPDAYDESSASMHLPVSPTLHPGISLVGIIEKKCDSGYFVTVNVGSEQLKGVLYHIPNMPQSSCNSDIVQHRMRKRSRLTIQDPSRPKPNRSGYTFFFAEHYARLKPSFRGQERAISKKIGLLWSKLSEAEKQVYQDKGMKDKERYRTELLEYKSSHNLQLHG